VARFVKGDVVVVLFPFSNLSQNKRRPALVLAELEGDDLILCQITSQKRGDRYAVQLNHRDFVEGSLKQESNIRPNRIFTADTSIISYSVGNLKPDKLKEVIDKVIEILNC